MFPTFVSHTIGMSLVLSVCAVCSPTPAHCGEKLVRPLSIEFPAESPSGLPYHLVFSKTVEPNTVHACKNANDCKKLLGDEWGQKFADKIDFSRDQLVLAIWELRGDTPDNWRTTATVKDGSAIFKFVRNKERNGPQVQLITIGMTPFAVSKSVKIDNKLQR